MHVVVWQTLQEQKLVRENYFNKDFSRIFEFVRRLIYRQGGRPCEEEEDRGDLGVGVGVKNFFI